MTDIKDEDIWKKQLLSTVRTFRRLSGDMRFGQFLYNAISQYDREAEGCMGALDMNYQEDFHQRLFYLEDQELASILEYALKDNEDFLATLKST